MSAPDLVIGLLDTLGVAWALGLLLAIPSRRRCVWGELASSDVSQVFRRARR